MEKQIKIRIVLAIIYGIIGGFLALLAAGCVDGTATVGMTGKVAVAGTLFFILAIMEIMKAKKLADEM